MARFLIRPTGDDDGQYRWSYEGEEPDAAVASGVAESEEAALEQVRGLQGARSLGKVPIYLVRGDDERPIPPEDNFILGLDLDGVVADFYGTMRALAEEWFGLRRGAFDGVEPTYGLREWGFNGAGSDYEAFHRWAVTEKELFTSLAPIQGAGPALRRLSDDKVRIRIITNRLFVSHFHKPAVVQTIDWLDRHAIPYWDLCLMPDKESVYANVYLEDTPKNIERLRAADCDVIIFENSTNLGVAGERVHNWNEAEAHIRTRLGPAKPSAPTREQLLEQRPQL